MEIAFELGDLKSFDRNTHFLNTIRRPFQTIILNVSWNAFSLTLTGFWTWFHSQIYDFENFFN